MRLRFLTGKREQPVTVHIHVDASTIDVRQLTERIRAELIRQQRRNGEKARLA